MMQESGTEATSNGPANLNGGGSVDGGSREGRPKSTTPSMEVTAAELLHLQQHQVDQSPFYTGLLFIKTCQQQPPLKVPLNI